MKHNTLLIAVLCLILSTNLVFAAKDPAKNTEADDGPMTLGKVSMPGLAFRSIGPAVTGGRIHDVEADPANPSTRGIKTQDFLSPGTKTPV